MTQPHDDMISVGIDWADWEHAFHLISHSQKPIAGTIQQDPADIRDVIESLLQHAWLLSPTTPLDHR